MQKYKLFGVAALAILYLLTIPRPAYAYLDPGTTGSVFAFLGPLLAMFLGFLGFMIRPVRSFFASIITRLRGGSRAESPEGDAAEAGDTPDNDEHDANQ